MLDLNLCHVRQNRFREALEQIGAGACVVTSPASIYYLSGALPEPRLPHAFVVNGSGSVLVTNSNAAAAADRTIRYESYSLERVISRGVLVNKVAREVSDALRREPHVGIESEWCLAAVREALSGNQVSDVTPVLQRLRRHKDPDEVAQLRQVVAIAEAGYASAKLAVKPGNTECDVFNAAAAGTVACVGTSPFVQGDFACGNRAREGGPPTTRKIAAGDLFIIDFFPGYEGYRADLCRTFAASAPTDLQLRAWEHVRGALAVTERLLKPGVPGAEFYRALRTYLDEFAPARDSFYHHAGHGVGLDAQEFPWLTPGSDHVLEEGDVVAVEPGLYSEALQGGIRLEQNYLITASGCERLSNFPLELT